ncbi:SAM-dependent methyltransferase [Candidatus Falkowbacteria bacterium CG11_big_fil_rev_8_21_14_0_20_39_10]|uniref:SAM-dependent methyltransferase n=1 Tax=Candidatus Falkowbacteria bacterium CG11_big_fil_rev_8_21_14_0_20_39_10 TaxID=1974570 RepID=A0A2M6K8J6_9BACT|nr:MAG: SAM-dependent methyltransferase [Candidatus Falkowbacteria bacterium CG11_big_fil_rev_8_21_14_0_20_39_10]
MNKECIICHETKSKIAFKEFEVDILKCQNCGHIFSSYEQDQNYNGYFGDKVEADDSFWFNQAHKKIYDDFCQKFIAGKKGRLLDVGCGLGYFVKKVSHYSDWEAYGYEISKSAVDFAKEKLNLKNIYHGRVEEAQFLKKYFNIITLWDVIEHIPNPDLMLGCLNSILKDDGFIFIHTPNIKIQLPKARIKRFFKGMKEGVHYLEAKDHINVYSPKTMEKILGRNGFENVGFIHLHPIQSMAGSKNIVLKWIKNLWYWSAKFLFFISFKKVNINNLFAIAKK